MKKLNETRQLKLIKGSLIKIEFPPHQMSINTKVCTVGSVDIGDFTVFKNMPSLSV